MIMNVWIKILRATGFWLSFGVIFLLAQFPFKESVSPALSAEFLERPLDILYMGSSHVNTVIQPAMIENLTGLSGYGYGAPGARVDQLYYLLKDMVHHQSPKYIILETSSIIAKDPLIDQQYVVADQIINDQVLLHYTSEDIPAQYWDEALLPLWRNHTKWKEGFSLIPGTLNNALFGSYNAENLGYFGYTKAINESAYRYVLKKDYSNLTWPGGVEAVPTGDQQASLQDIVDLCEQKGIQLILLRNANLPSMRVGNFIWLEEFAEDHDLAYIDLNKVIFPEDLSRVDLYNMDHFTQNGTLPLNVALAEALSEELGLPVNQSMLKYYKSIYIQEARIDKQGNQTTVTLIPQLKDAQLEIKYQLFLDGKPIDTKEFKKNAYVYTFNSESSGDYSLTVTHRLFSAPELITIKTNISIP